MSVSGLLVFDKPEGFTSQDAVAVVRKIFGTRRAGHTGTLDPMATGLLIICLGRATRAVEFLMEGWKAYETGFKLGIKTDTGDITGSIVDKSDSRPLYQELEAALEGFRGETSQIPPMYSAIKKNGQPLYVLARRGEEIEREPRKITIDRIDLLDYNGESGEGRLYAECSKGTYIRTLIEDIACAAGTVGTMSALRRVSNGPFDINSAITLERLRSLAGEGAQESVLISVDCVFEQYPALKISDGAATKFIRNGRDMPCESPDGRYRVYSEGGEFLAFSALSKGYLKTIKSFYETDVE